MCSRQIPALLLAAAVLLGVAAAPAQARYSAKKAFWGPGIVNGVSQFPRYRELGVGIYEQSLLWADVAPTRPAHPRDPRDPAYRWPEGLAEALAEANRYRMRVAIQIFGAPRWANGGHDQTWAPQNARDFADFAYAASRRYRSVHLWMVWGEPSKLLNFKPLTPARLGAARLTPAQASAPRRYARLLDAAYGALKRANLKNRVIGGMTFTSGAISAWQWIRYMRLPNGRPPRLDLYGHNPITWRAPSWRSPPSCCGLSDFNDLPRLGRAVDRNLGRGRRVPFFLSEFFLPTAPDSELNIWVDPPVQAAWIREALKLVRRSSRIFAFGWIHLYDDPPSRDGSRVSHSGLLHSDGSPKPGYFAFSDG
jgi:hypothetical protein